MRALSTGLMALGAATSIVLSASAYGETFEEELVQAAKGQLGQFRSPCQRVTGRTGEMLPVNKQCEEQALQRAVEADQKRSIETVVQMLNTRHVGVAQVNRERLSRTHYQCYNEGAEWSRFVVNGLVTLAITGRETAEINLNRVREMIEGIKQKCEPNDVQSFMNNIGVIAKLLDPVTAVRRNEISVMLGLLNEGFAQASEEKKAEEALAQRKQEEAKQQKAAAKAAQDRQAAAAEAERMRDPAYRAELARRKEIQQGNTECISSATENLNSCIARNMGNSSAVKACSEVSHEIILICNRAVSQCISNPSCDKQGYHKLALKTLGGVR